MFDFEKLDVFQVAHQQNIKMIRFLGANVSIEKNISERWKDASMGIVTNISESAGRINMNDKKDFLVAARSSVFECVTFMMTCKDLSQITEAEYLEFYAAYEQLSKMLLGMYRSYNKDNNGNTTHKYTHSEVKPSNF